MLLLLLTTSRSFVYIDQQIVRRFQVTTYYDTRTDGLTGQKHLPTQLCCVGYKYYTVEPR
jgi:hypothetical protein